MPFLSGRRREIFLPKALIQRKRYGAKAIAPSGLMVFTGDRFSRWHGDIFVGGLRSQDIRRIDLDDAGRVMAQTALRIGHCGRDLHQGPEGLIYVLTDEAGGHLIRLEPAVDSQSPPPP